ncbi:MAG: hypothetical protein WBA74_10670 [Cyclobacteriaceae bacterium]
MRRIFSLIALLLTVGVSVKAQNGIYDFGGRSAGMANSSVTIADAYSLFNNIGALARVEETTAFVGYRNLFGINELSTIAAGFVKPIKSGVLGISFFRFGGDLFNEQKASIGYSNQFGLVSLGANISYLQVSIESIGKSSVFLFEFGGLAKITDKLRVGAYVFNLNQAAIASGSEQEIPLTMKVGVSYLPIEDLAINTEVIKQIDREEQIRIGLSYNLIKNFTVRTGIETNPVKGTFGLGFKPGRFLIDYAFSNHSIIGDIHDISFGITL